MSALFILFPRLLVADWSYGVTFSWREGTPDIPVIRTGEMSYTLIIDRKNYDRHLPGPLWKAEVESLVARARAAPPRPRREE
ncbi:MAG: hypothetical protein LBQ12_05640 [Deltaproteobacteria bacterium]|jgi:hypothetical protein|nr:hypothetical protein [Deltaproteobacteria bacterium]